MVSAIFHSPRGDTAPPQGAIAAAAANDAIHGTPATAHTATTAHVHAAATSITPPPPSRLRQRLAALAQTMLPPVMGLALLVGLWSLVSGGTGQAIPGPLETWQQAVEVFSDPFYRNGPNDQGAGVVLGGAARVGIPLGFVIGRFRFLSRMCNPLISLLRPVSPLAWLPIG